MTSERTEYQQGFFAGLAAARRLDFPLGWVEKEIDPQDREVIADLIGIGFNGVGYAWMDPTDPRRAWLLDAADNLLKHGYARVDEEAKQSGHTPLRCRLFGHRYDYVTKYADGHLTEECSHCTSRIDGRWRPRTTPDTVKETP